VREVVGVIPAAGHATRLQPLDSSKEVLPVRGRPVLEYVAERMRVGGCTRLRVVTRAEKVDLIDLCRRLDAEVVLAQPATVGESLAAGLHDLDGDDVVLIGFPDTIWEPVDGYRRLLAGLTAGCEVALGLFGAPSADLSRSDVVVVDTSMRVLGIEVKPRTPASRWIWGCAAARVRVLDGLERADWPGTHFDGLCRAGVDVRGYVLSDEWLDIGTKGALEQARRA
jgi:glucose-1-phosphate thymidylyltransferase